MKSTKPQAEYATPSLPPTLKPESSESESETSTHSNPNPPSVSPRDNNTPLIMDQTIDHLFQLMKNLSNHVQNHATDFQYFKRS